MTEPKKSDHWELLANNLGAAPPAGEPEGAPRAPAEPPHPTANVKPAKPKTRPSAAPRRAGDWDSLVSELGVAAKVEPTEKAASEPAVSQSPAAAPPRRVAAERPFAEAAGGQTVQRSGARQENSAAAVESFAEELPEIVDEHFSSVEEPYEAKSPAFGGIEEPFGLRKDESVEERADEEGDDRESPKAKSGRRRRKRRRRTSAPAEKTSESTAEKTAADERVQDGSAPSDELTVVYDVSEEVAEPVPGVAGAEQPEPSAERTKRRRKRRGSSRKKQKRDEVVAVVESPTIEPTAEPAVELDDEVGDAEQAVEAIEHDDEFDDEESADDSETAKTIHRGIPTWEETIDLIVSKNMEMRAKKGSGANRGWNSGRGGSKPRTASTDQPSHRGRGGRGKSSKKRS